MILLTGFLGNMGSRLAPLIGEFIGIDTKDGKDLLTCELPENIDIIYHLAAHAFVPFSWNDPVRNIQNLVTTVRLVHRYPDAKIIFASTGASFNPESSPYAFSKWACNEYLKKYHKNAVILYFPNIFGTPRSVVDIFKGKDEVVIYGDGLQTRDYIHVDDAVKALFKAQDWAVGEYYCGSGVETNLLQLAEGKSVIFKEARKEQRESVLPNTTPLIDNTTRAWQPKIDVIDYINGSGIT